MTVDDLILELEKHKGKKVYVSLGMTFRIITDIECEEEESDIVYLISEK